jgi:hypothetical protein
MNGRIQGRRIRIRHSPSVAASLLTKLNPFLVNVTGQSGYELNGLSSGASNVCIGSIATGRLPLGRERSPLWSESQRDSNAYPVEHASRSL